MAQKSYGGRTVKKAAPKPKARVAPKKAAVVRNPAPTPPGQKGYDGSSKSILENTYVPSDAAWVDAVNNRSTIHNPPKTKMKKYALPKKWGKR